MFNLASRSRPYFGAIVLSTTLLIAGGVWSFLRMPSAVYPEITFPRISVIARKPGLDLVNMELQVTQPLEQAIHGVVGVGRIRSKTIRGASELSIDFDPGTNMRWAKSETANLISAVRLPPDMEPPTVEQMSPSVFPIASIVLTGGDSPAQLRDYAFYELAPAIKNLADVTYANVAGGDVREIEIEPRLKDLFALNMSAADLAEQIGRAHRLQPVGRIDQGPVAYQILINTQVESARGIEDLVITPPNNQPVRVGDVADVRALGYQDRTQSVGFESKDAVVITVFRRLGGNTVNISRDLRALLARYPMPRNIHATVAYDQARFVTTAVHNVRDAILVGSLFSILILLAFLHSWRATLISALAIPTTLAITFVFLHWTGETLNLMSLGGLAVAIGLIIDDTVVVVENIARHLQAGRAGSVSDRSAPVAYAPGSPLPDPVDAASGEITGAVVGSTLTTVLVFVPLAFIVGVYGQFFAALSWSLAIAVLVSMVISLTLVPMFAAKFLRGRPMPQPGRIYDAFANVYERMLGGALRYPWAMLALSLAAVAVGIVLYTGIPGSGQVVNGKAPEPRFRGLQTGLMPLMDEGTFTVDYFAPAGTSLRNTEQKARVIEQILEENPDVEAYVRRTGAELGMFATKTNRGDIQVILRPAEQDPISLVTRPMRDKFDKIEDKMKEEGKKRAEAKYGPAFTEAQMWAQAKAYIRERYRRRPIQDVMNEIQAEIREHFSEHQLKFETVQIMQDELNDLSGSNRPIEVKLVGPKYAELQTLGKEVAEMLKTKGEGHGIEEVVSGVTDGNPDLMVRVNGYWKVRGLRAQEVERQLQVIYQGQVATQVRESAQRNLDVRVHYPDALRFGSGGHFSPDLVKRQLILLPENLAPTTDASSLAPPHALVGPARLVPLASLAELDRVRTPDEQMRENSQPVVIVTAQHKEDEAGLNAVVADVHRWMGDVHMPANYVWEIGGHYIQQQEAFRSLAVVMIVAILLVYIMLAFQFASVVLPLLIFLTQPLSLVSGLFALWLTNTPLNVSSYMGAILLIGLDMKNGILLVEYIQQLRKEGMELREALLLAGRTRFRPILMTSLAAILGLFPLALGIGPGAQMQQPLAIMVIGGLTANMLFTRLIIPVGYLVLERRKTVQVAPVEVPSAWAASDGKNAPAEVTVEKVSGA